MSIYGYARISGRDQREDRQIIALQGFGVDRIFIDRQSGKDFDRPQYQRLLRRLKATDVLVVKSIDRLGRNYAEILDQWRVITKDKGAAIVVLDMPLLDTRNQKDFLGTLIADLTLQIMSAFAQIERDFIRQRQAEGIAAAKARGVRFGRKPLPRPDNYPDVRNAWQAGKISARQAAKLLGVSHFTFSQSEKSVFGPSNRLGRGNCRERLKTCVTGDSGAFTGLFDSRDGHGHDCSASFARTYRQFSAAHHFDTLLYVRQCDMRFAFVVLR